MGKNLPSFGRVAGFEQNTIKFLSDDTFEIRYMMNFNINDRIYSIDRFGDAHIRKHTIRNSIGNGRFASCVEYAIYSNDYGYYFLWCKSKSIKSSKPKYICDRTKAEGWKLIFYTNPQITFYSDPSEEELWIEILNKITLQGFPSFDWD